MVGVMYQINLVDFGDCSGFILNVKSWTLVSKIGALDALYLQIEDNVIAVKMAKTESTDSTVAIRWNLYDYFKSKTPEFNKEETIPQR